ncbi:MAG: hypothetical protein GY810_00945 [Aureispira sp.]|nr:hypothetical protein [Aureispira sp.]
MSKKHWMIYFEDTDRQELIFTEEEPAREYYGKVLDSWSCHLFEQVMEGRDEIPKNRKT